MSVLASEVMRIVKLNLPLQLFEWKRASPDHHTDKAYLLLERGGHLVPVRYQGAINKNLMQVDSTINFQSGFRQWIWQVRSLLGAFVSAGYDMMEPS